MVFMKFNSHKRIYVISKYRKETWIKENDCIWQIKMHSNVFSKIIPLKTNFFIFYIQKRNLD